MRSGATNDRQAMGPCLGRTGLAALGLLAALAVSCTPDSFQPPVPTSGSYSVLAALIKGNDSIGGQPQFGMPIAVVVPGPVSAEARDTFLDAASLAALQVYPGVLALSGDQAEAENQALKLIASAVGNRQVQGAKVTLDSDPLPERNGIHAEFGASGYLKHGQAYRLVADVAGKSASAGVILPRPASIQEPKKAATVPDDADLLVKWLPQTTANAFQVELAAAGPNASGSELVVSPFLSGDVSQYRIPREQFPSPGAAAVTVKAIGGLSAEDFAANRSNVQGAGGAVVAITVTDTVVTVVPAEP